MFNYNYHKQFHTTTGFIQLLFVMEPWLNDQWHSKHPQSCVQAAHYGHPCEVRIPCSEWRPWENHICWGKPQGSQNWNSTSWSPVQSSSYYLKKIEKYLKLQFLGVYLHTVSPFLISNQYEKISCNSLSGNRLNHHPETPGGRQLGDPSMPETALPHACGGRQYDMPNKHAVCLQTKEPCFLEELCIY